ncbi:MAG TPA: ATP-binding protein [Thermoanaerobaculia bacterium]|nr:ATP-binding protein [Thermoanaerobaculia bacterium]
MTKVVDPRENDQTLRLLIERVEEYAIFMLDARGHVITWNAGAERIKGYSAADIIGQHFSIFYTPDDIASNKPARELEQAAATGKYEEEGWRLRKDGTQFWANVLITSLVESDGTLRGFAKVTRDMTERRNAQERLEHALEIAEAANRAKDEFLTTISHELRTPLTSILGWASLLRLGRDTPGELERGLQSIEESAQVQARLVDDLLDYSRIATGNARLQFDPVDVDGVVSQAIDAIRPTAAAKNIDVRFELPAERVQVLGDAARIQQILWNLLTNAVKFTPRNGSVTVTAKAGDQLAIEVRDTGRGLTRELRERVFDRFWQADPSSTRSEGGTGLGLSIARQLAEVHGGALDAESEGLDKGATFRVLLPLLSRSPRAATTAGPTAALPSLRGLHILVLEDDLHARRFLTALVEQCGARVTTAASVGEALTQVQRNRLDLIVSDIAMPGEAGFAFIQKLRALEPALPAIAVTAVYLDPADRGRLLTAGFDEYVRKPVMPAELAERIDSLVKRSEEL